MSEEHSRASSLGTTVLIALVVVCVVLGVSLFLVPLFQCPHCDGIGRFSRTTLDPQLADMSWDCVSCKGVGRVRLARLWTLHKPAVPR
jgi:transcription elongation factor Elf1